MEMEMDSVRYVFLEVGRAAYSTLLEFWHVI